MLTRLPTKSISSSQHCNGKSEDSRDGLLPASEMPGRTRGALDHRSLDPDIAKRHGRIGIRLDADKSRRQAVDLGDAALRIGVIEDRG